MDVAHRRNVVFHCTLLFTSKCANMGELKWGIEGVRIKGSWVYCHRWDFLFMKIELIRRANASLSPVQFYAITSYIELFLSEALYVIAHFYTVYGQHINGKLTSTARTMDTLSIYFAHMNHYIFSNVCFHSFPNSCCFFFSFLSI